MADTRQNPSIQVRLLLIFPLILIRLSWDLKQIRHVKQHVDLRDFQTKIWLKTIDEQPVACQ